MTEQARNAIMTHSTLTTRVGLKNQNYFNEQNIFKKLFNKVMPEKLSVSKTALMKSGATLSACCTHEVIKLKAYQIKNNYILYRETPHKSLIIFFFNLSQVDLESFFKIFDMPDTYYSWWLITELHVWMLCVRLSVGNTKGKQLNIWEVNSDISA